MRNRVVLLVVLFLVGSGLAMAQETTSGSLTGSVVDTQGTAVPGAQVTVTSDQGSKTFTTDSNGRFFAPFLTPGAYSVKVELAGLLDRRAEEHRRPARSALELKSLTLKVGERHGDHRGRGGVAGHRHAAPRPSAALSTATRSGSCRWAATSPTRSTWSPASAAAAAWARPTPRCPGRAASRTTTSSTASTSPTAGYGGVGSYSIVFGSLGSGVTTDFIKETQVKTAGFEAEYGQSTGGVVNVVTQSGTQRLPRQCLRLLPAERDSRRAWKQGVSPNGDRQHHRHRQLRLRRSTSAARSSRTSSSSSAPSTPSTRPAPSSLPRVSRWRPWETSTGSGTPCPTRAS